VGNTVGSLTSTQKSIVIGSIIGDGSLRRASGRKNALLEVNHSFDYKEYVDWKYDKLKDIVITPPKPRRGNEGRVAYRFTTRSIPEITELYNKFYANGRKFIPNDIKLDPLVMAVWFMDDGSKSYKSLYLNTQRFNSEDQKILMDKLFKQWNILSSLNKDKIYYRIRISVDSTPKFKRIISSFILPIFAYKLM